MAVIRKKFGTDSDGKIIAALATLGRGWGVGDFELGGEVIL